MKATPIQLIETMRVDPGRRITLMAWHQARLKKSCRDLGYTWPGQDLYSAIQQHLLQLNAAGVFRLRILVEPCGRYLIESGDLPATPALVDLYLSADAVDAEDPWLQHKTTHRPRYAAAQEWLNKNSDAFDLVFFNQHEQLCEGSRSNIYIESNVGAWITPPSSCGLLAGVQRQALLDRGLAQEGLLTRKDLLTARSIRVSNALRGWVPARLAAQAPVSTKSTLPLYNQA